MIETSSSSSLEISIAAGARTAGAGLGFGIAARGGGDGARARSGTLPAPPWPRASPWAPSVGRPDCAVVALFPRSLSNFAQNAFVAVSPSSSLSLSPNRPSISSFVFVFVFAVFTRRFDGFASPSPPSRGISQPFFA
eukprot:3665-Pelagococcus_subviridis.AAC.1